MGFYTKNSKSIYVMGDDMEDWGITFSEAGRAAFREQATYCYVVICVVFHYTCSYLNRMDRKSKELTPERKARRKQATLQRQMTHQKQAARRKQAARCRLEARRRWAVDRENEALEREAEKDGSFGYYIIRDGKKLCTYGIPEAGSHYVRIYE